MTESNKSLDELVKSLDNEMTPSRDLWPGIEQAISKTPQNAPTGNDANFNVLTKVAAAFAPIALVAGLWLGQPNEMVETPQWLTPVSAGYELQKRQLLQQVSGKPVVSENWQQDLQELEAAENALKKALIEQPQDPALMRMLNQVYQQQLELIEKSHKPKFSQI